MDPQSELSAWLRKVNARSLWTLTVSRFPNPFTLIAYQVNGRVLLLQDFGPNGWQIYAWVDDRNDGPLALESAERAVGLIPDRDKITVDQFFNTQEI